MVHDEPHLPTMRVDDKEVHDNGKQSSHVIVVVGEKRRTINHRALRNPTRRNDIIPSYELSSERKDWIWSHLVLVYRTMMCLGEKSFSDGYSLPQVTANRAS